jgi:NAD(P)-dependent dehydrogenase (short-subunit alcohol dehydrogenase family)
LITPKEVAPIRHAEKVALVTGSASGIGAATCARLLDEGATVVGCDISTQAPAWSQDGGTFVGGLDVTNQADVDEVVGSTATLGAGRIDVLCNVAGIADRYLAAHEVDDETWQRVMAVNVDGPMRMSRAVLALMLEQKSGAIVNVASAAGMRGGTAGAAYTASKHAVIGLTRSIAWTYAYEGIRCNAVLPGGTHTPIVDSLEPPDSWVYRRYRAVLRQGVRMAQPDELAATISWLASSEASNVNGAMVASDGGWSAG